MEICKSLQIYRIRHCSLNESTTILSGARAPSRSTPPSVSSAPALCGAVILAGLVRRCTCALLCPPPANLPSFMGAAPLLCCSSHTNRGPAVRQQLGFELGRYRQPWRHNRSTRQWRSHTMRLQEKPAWSDPAYGFKGDSPKVPWACSNQREKLLTLQLPPREIPAMALELSQKRKPPSHTTFSLPARLCHSIARGELTQR